MATREAAAANRDAAARRAATAPGAEKRRARLPLIVAGVVAVVAAIAIAVSVATDGGNRPDAIEDEAAELRIEGEPLPAFVQGAPDLAEGMEMPTMSGTALDGQPLQIGATQGPMLLVYLAHWCPVCQTEVPVVRDWAAGGGAEGINVRAVSTGWAPERGNWPSSQWLEDEGWDHPTLLDPTGAASVAAGQSNFPFFIAVDGDGEVVARVPGAVDPEGLDLLASLARGEGS